MVVNSVGQIALGLDMGKPMAQQLATTLREAGLAV